MEADSIFGDNHMTLEKPYFPGNLATIDRVPEGTKRCRICQAIKPLDQFRTLTHHGRSWPYYACNPCSRDLQREAYQRKRSKLPLSGESDLQETTGCHGNT